MTEFLAVIKQVVSAGIGWIGEVASAFFGTASANTTAGLLADLLPFLGLSLGVGLVGLGVKYVRSFIKIG